jgi:hypothetical protein
VISLPSSNEAPITDRARATGLGMSSNLGQEHGAVGCHSLIENRSIASGGIQTLSPGSVSRRPRLPPLMTHLSVGHDPPCRGKTVTRKVLPSLTAEYGLSLLTAEGPVTRTAQCERAFASVKVVRGSVDEMT